MKGNDQKGELGHFQDARRRDDAHSGGFLETDLVLPRTYPNVVVWKDLGYGSALGDKIPMKGMLSRSNGEVKNTFYCKTPRTTCLSHVTQTQKSLYEDYTK